MAMFDKIKAWGTSAQKAALKKAQMASARARRMGNKVEKRFDKAFEKTTSRINTGIDRVKSGLEDSLTTSTGRLRTKRRVEKAMDRSAAIRNSRNLMATANTGRNFVVQGGKYFDKNKNAKTARTASAMKNVGPHVTGAALGVGITVGAYEKAGRVAIGTIDRVTKPARDKVESAARATYKATKPARTKVAKAAKATYKKAKKKSKPIKKEVTRRAKRGMADFGVASTRIKNLARNTINAQRVAFNTLRGQVSGGSLGATIAYNKSLPRFAAGFAKGKVDRARASMKRERVRARTRKPGTYRSPSPGRGNRRR